MGSNYPPGAANDPRAPYNQRDHSHECGWELVPDAPIIEDGAAIFREECVYAEGEWGEGWSCDEHRTQRFEYSTLEPPGTEEIDLPDAAEWGKVDDEIADRVYEIQEAFAAGDAEIEVDSGRTYGSVRLTYDGWTLVFRP